MKFSFMAVFFLLSLAPLVSAHGEEAVQDLASNSFYLIILAGLVSGLLALISVLKKKKSPIQKKALFLGIAVPVLFATAYSAASTIYLNLASESQGPVHWHADFEIWNCGERLDLMDPEGMLNRIGSPLFHEHGDNRIHIEGVVSELEDVSLHEFFESIGGGLEDGSLSVPANSGHMELADGQDCQGQPGKLQAFLYRVTNPDPSMRTGFTFAQEKLLEYGDYVPAPYSNVPPGDCLILEFGQEKERTERICGTYRIAIEKGELREE